METGTQCKCSKIKSSYVKLRAAPTTKKKKKNEREENARICFALNGTNGVELLSIHSSSEKSCLKNNNIFLHTKFSAEQVQKLYRISLHHHPHHFSLRILSYFSHTHFFFLLVCQKLFPQKNSNRRGEDANAANGCARVRGRLHRISRSTFRCNERLFIHAVLLLRHLKSFAYALVV